LNPNFETVKLARDWLKAQSEQRAGEGTRAPNEGTAADYRRVMERLLKKGDPWLAAADTTKKSTYFKRRAAILHCTREVIETRMKAQDLLQRNNGLKDPAKLAQWSNEVAAIKNAMRLVVGIPEETPLKEVENRETKRKNLGKLPDDWRAQIVKRMPKYQDQALVTALVGCRPVELQRGGVEVSLKDGELVLRVLGAKLGENSGQEWREVAYKMPTENQLALQLAMKVRRNDGPLHIRIDNERQFSGAMRSAGRRAFKGFPETVTPYSMRHQLSSDMKAAGLDGDAISSALGHSSADTKSSYGLFALGTGGMSPDRACAARVVRASKKGDLSPDKPRGGPRGP